MDKSIDYSHAYSASSLHNNPHASIPSHACISAGLGLASKLGINMSPEEDAAQDWQDQVEADTRTKTLMIVRTNIEMILRKGPFIN